LPTSGAALRGDPVELDAASMIDVEACGADRNQDGAQGRPEEVAVPTLNRKGIRVENKEVYSLVGRSVPEHNYQLGNRKVSSHNIITVIVIDDTIP
jgi:hypothetical protein